MNMHVNVQEIIPFRNIKEQSKAKTERETEKEENTIFGRMLTITLPIAKQRVCLAGTSKYQIEIFHLLATGYFFFFGQHRHIKIFTEEHDEMKVDEQDTRQRNGENEKRAHHEYLITSLLLP
jgi:hypothetical protein